MMKVKTYSIKKSTARLKDIAIATSSSLSTVSKALSGKYAVNEQTRERIISTAKTLNYSTIDKPPGEKVSKIDKGNLGLVLFIDCEAYLSDPFFTPVLHQIGEYAHNHDHYVRLLTCDTSADHNLNREKLLAFAVGLEGLLVFGPISADLLKELELCNIPYVMEGTYASRQGRFDLSIKPCFVMWDDTRIGREATNILFGKGYDRIAFITEKIIPGMQHAKNLEGFVLAHYDVGRQVSKDQIFVADQIFADMKSIAAQIKKMELEKTGFLVPDCRIAKNLIMALNQAGCAVNKDAFCIIGAKHIFPSMNLESYPHIATDLRLLTTVALDTLRQIVRQPCLWPTTIFVPFESNY